MNTSARYTTPIANPFAVHQPDADVEVEHEPLFESAVTQIGAFDWIKDKSPTLAFIAGNLLLAIGEYRVYDFALQNTGEVWKAWFSVSATFFPFVLWEVAVQHAKASGIMRAIAWLGISISLLLGVLIGMADFMVTNGRVANAEGLLGFLAVSLSIHAILFLAYFYSHPDIKAHRLTAQAIAKQQLAESSASVAENILKSARTRLELERRIAAEYGYENLRRAIAEIEGRPYHAPKKTFAPRNPGFTPEHSALNIPNESAPAFSGNGHKPGDAPDFP
jgi:hypothetical protein